MSSLKKIITIDSIMEALFSTIGYSFGYIIPSSKGVNMLFSIVICIVAGMVLDKIANAVVFSEFIQRRRARRYAAFAIIAVFFIIAQKYSLEFLSYSILRDAGIGLLSVIIMPVLGFMYSLCMHSAKVRKIREKYGKGDYGFITDQKAKDYMAGINGRNKRIYGKYDTNAAAKTANGIFVGTKSNRIKKYLGIPYAKPPVGQLRWKAPQPMDESNEVYEAFRFGYSEVQPENTHSIINWHNQSEDCLYLNVWTPDNGKNNPVVVYFHGGDGRYGGSANPLYDFDRISNAFNDTVFVSFNFRLGIFGVVDFSKLPDGNDYPDSACLSLLDQLQALRWVKKNIAAFGGNPDNVTVAGDSSGATGICQLAAMPEAKGLFKRAFLLAGSITNAPADMIWARKLGEKLAEKFNAKSVCDLLKVPAEALKEAGREFYVLTDIVPRGSKYVPADINERYKHGSAADIDFIFGITADDSSAWNAMITGEFSITEIIDGIYYSLCNRISPEKKKKLDGIMESHAKSAGCPIQDAKMKILNTIAYKTSILANAGNLAKGGSDVHCFFWNPATYIEKFTANTISVLTTILDNYEVAESMGYINKSEITQIMQAFLHKFITGKPLEIYHNEISGINEISWPPFRKIDDGILHVTEEDVTCRLEVFSGLCRELYELFADESL